MIKMVKQVRTGGKKFGIGETYALGEAVEKKWIKSGWAQKSKDKLSKNEQTQ